MIDIKNNIQLDKLPKHIAIIMDGNGRWAKKRGRIRIFGHENGVKAVRNTVEACAELGIEALTMYAFSTENWNRPQKEVDRLMSLLVSSLNKELKTFIKNDIKLEAIGEIAALPEKTYKTLQKVIEATRNHKKMTLSLALNYGSRDEIINVVKNVAKKVKNNIINIEDIDQVIINEHLYTQNLPDVDLLIRTSGEKRISNFLLWQIAYAELVFTEVLWPDFKKEDLYHAIIDYQNRERRFGKTSEQLK
jgi:undecaprenyl diphosphate synthase